MATDELLDEIRDLIAEREELGIRGLADRLGPSDWADIVVRLDEDEVAVLLESIPDDEIPEILEELDPANAAAILRLRPREEAADLLEAIDPDDATDIIAELPSRRSRADPARRWSRRKRPRFGSSPPIRPIPPAAA